MACLRETVETTNGLICSRATASLSATGSGRIARQTQRDTEMSKTDSEVKPRWSHDNLSKWVWLGSAIALTFAVLPLPYAYYTFLRWGITGTAILCAVQESGISNKVANFFIAIFVIIAMLFNPLVPFHLGKELWAVINLSAAVVFIAHYYLFKRRLRILERADSNL
jgi:hypothetical protein